MSIIDSSIWSGGAADTGLAQATGVQNGKYSLLYSIILQNESPSRYFDTDNGPCRGQFYGSKPACGMPSTNNFSSPGWKALHDSFVVSGSVTMMATRSSGVVSCAKSTLISSSDSRAVSNGC